MTLLSNLQVRMLSPTYLNTIKLNSRSSMEYQTDPITNAEGCIAVMAIDSKFTWVGQFLTPTLFPM